MASGLENIETIESPFRRFVTTIGVFPTAFTDAMTYYECLAYLVKYMEDTMIPAINENAEAVEELQGLYIQLKAFVDNYFDNLDVQEEINNKLDQMAEDGTLQELINNYLQTNVTWVFETVDAMKASTNLVNGSYAETLGYTTKNDNGGAKYLIKTKTTETPNDRDIIGISDTLIAEIFLNDEKINVKQFGAKGDDSTDDTTAIQASIDYALANNISNVIMPKGVYKTTAPIMLYDFINLRGFKREETVIKKYGHTTDSVYNMDSVLSATNKPSSSLTYPRYITIENISLDSGDHASQPTYGFYVNTGAFFTINQFASRYTGTCIYLGDVWLSTIKEVSTGYGTVGFRINGGTTLDINDVYTAENSAQGYYIQGLSYSHLSNLACDSAPSSEAYYIYYSQLSIDALGCEAENYTNCLHLQNSQVSINDSNLRVNHSSASSVVLYLQESSLNLNNVTVGKETNLTSANGKFLHFQGNGSFLTINASKVYPASFLTANTGNNRNNISINNKYGMFNTTPSALGFIGNAQPEFDDTVDFEKLGIKELHAQLSSPANHITNNDINGTSIAYERDNRPIAAIIPNAGLNVDGAVMFVKSSYDKITELVNPITATSLSDGKLVLTFSSLSLGTNLDNMKIKLNTNWRIRKKGTSGWTAITAIDTANSTITANTGTGFAVGDYVEVLPPRDIRECSFMPVQGILMGATADRPSEPKNGTMYYDTSLNKPIWWVTNHWKDATGTNV